ncbi:MAG: sulfotransferase domain-containing protein [Geminicoccaceae bacterium]|nr:sulfotransferase domain-containing protein [Geminicoccaceae bacterium]
MGRKPDFLIIGAMKSGTTSLWDDLCLNEQFFRSPEKEPNILIKYDNKDEIIRQYSSLFKRADQSQICGEASTWYTKLPHFDGVPQRAHDSIGDNLKLVMIMRDPVKRLYSHIQHHLVMDYVKPEDCDRVIFEDERYIAFSEYDRQLQPWIDIFGLSNLHCISLVDFRKDRHETLRKLYDFLDIRNHDQIKINTTVSNSGNELRSNHKSSWRKFLKSRFYTRVVRPNTPEFLRSSIRDRLMPIREVPDWTFSEETRNYIKGRLSGVQERLQHLIHHDIVINE